MFQITILFFGACREAVAANEIQFELTAPATVASAFDQLKQRYPELARFGTRLLFAVNENYATADQALATGDRLAIFPPVSGGSSEICSEICQLTRDEIDSRKLALRILQPGDGAIVTFDGVTRNNTRGRAVLFLEYESYEAMAIKTMHQIAQEARERWSIDGIAIEHRLGRVDICQTSVAIVVTSAHRKAAFEACHYLIDRLKQIVPIWKREYFEDGAVWVDPELQQP
jgi:MoaE-MoaD fusion protein